MPGCPASQPGITYDEPTRGTLQLFRTRKQFDGSAADIAVLQRSGVGFQLLDAAGCIEHEPALATVREKFVGGLLLPGDETGDCFKFTQRLAQLAAGQGVTFRQSVRIESLVRSGARLEGVQTDAGRLVADAYLLALGSYSATAGRTDRGGASGTASRTSSFGTHRARS